MKNFANDKFYHIYNKSIANYEIFNSEEDYERMKKAIKFFLYCDELSRFCDFLDLKSVEKKGFLNVLNSKIQEKEKVVEVIAYCLMPTHFHLILTQNKKEGISRFISKLSNSYTRYFNAKYNRKGPLWQGRYKRVEIDSDKQLLHLTRYIHLNPSSANLVNNPKDWEWSSFREYINYNDLKLPICNWSGVLEIDPEEYKEFVHARKNYQRELAIIKNKLLE